MNKGEIGELHTYLKDLYQGVRGEQTTDDTFYKDNFGVPMIKNPARLQRTGRASRMVDAPAEHIITSNPQVMRFPIKVTDKDRESALRVSSECNRWMSILKRQNPNPVKEFVKNLLLRGEAWIHPLHNELWVTGETRKPPRPGIPVLFNIPDPMVVFADPNEDENGVPKRLIICYDRKPSIIKERYPDWNGGDKLSKDASLATVEWLEYWDEDQIYFEADGVTVFDNSNVYGFVPFTHKLSGFGKTSPEGKMEDLIVGRLRKSRSLLVRECAIVSDIDSIFHLFSNRSLDVQPVDDQHSVPDDFASKYEMGAGLVHTIPFGVTITRSEEILPEPELFQYLYRLEANLDREDPLVMAGSAVGSTGRQQDMTMGSAMARYDTILENTEYAFATAVGMALEMVENIPTLCPEEYGLKKDDIGGNYEVTVGLKADDPIEADRKATLGSRLYAQGEIDLRTNLIKYQGYTESDAEEIITNMLVDKVTFQSPEIAQLIGMKAAEKLGVADEILALRQQNQATGQQQGDLGQRTGVPPSEMIQRTGEVQTPSGREQIDNALRMSGQRQSPSRYTRNQ